MQFGSSTTTHTRRVSKSTFVTWTKRSTSLERSAPLDGATCSRRSGSKQSPKTTFSGVLDHELRTNLQSGWPPGGGRRAQRREPHVHAVLPRRCRRGGVDDHRG